MDNQFEKQSEQKEEFRNSFLDGNELIEEAIANFYKENNQETFINILETIRQRMHADGHFIFPVLTDENDPERYSQVLGADTGITDRWGAAGGVAAIAAALGLTIWGARWLYKKFFEKGTIDEADKQEALRVDAEAVNSGGSAMLPGAV